MVDVREVGDETALLGECPVWSSAEQVLYWADIDGRKIHRYDPTTEASTTRELRGRPGSFALSRFPGRLLVAQEFQLLWLDWETGHEMLFADLEDPATGNRINDGRCDPAGRFVVGSMYPDGAAGKHQGFLYQVEGYGEAETWETAVGIPNGLVFDEERSRMYWADTLQSKIWQWDYDASTGIRRNKKVFFDYEAHPEIAGLPDGACLDAEGFYWSASVHGWAVTRIDPDGNVDRQIELPVAMPTMPAFGGENLETLFVTSIGQGVGDSELSRDGYQPGALLALEPGVRGVAEPVFAG